MVVVLYAPTLTAPFLFDDAVAVVRNETIRDLASWRIFQPPPEGGTTTGRPLLNASFALNYAVSGQDPWSYHLFNLGLHAMCAILLWAIVRRSLAGPVLGSRWAVRAGVIAGMAALGWAVHPLQTAAVSSVAQRSELLCGFLYLLTLYSALRYAMGSPSPRRWALLAIGASGLGMAAKEVMVTVPLMVLLLDRTAVAGSFTSAWRTRGGFYGALMATWVVLVFLLWSGGGSRGASAGFGLGVTPWTYLLKQCEALTTYLRLTIWPHPLVLDYGTAVITDVTMVWGRALGLLALLGGTMWALVRRPTWGLLGAWWFVILAPSSSLVPLVAQTMAEHRMYLPLAAIVVVGALALGSMGRPGIVTAVVVAIAWGAVTVGRNRDYQDPLVIWGKNVTAYPAGARGHLNYALELEQVGRTAEADAAFATAIRLRTDYAAAFAAWGAVQLTRGEVDAAVPRLQEAVRIGPGNADAWVNLGVALMKMDRAIEAAEAFVRAFELRPAPDVAVNLGITAEARGDWSGARRFFEEALRLDPTFAAAHERLASLNDPGERVSTFRAQGVAAARAGNWPTARARFEAALRLMPDDADAMANLGNVLLIQGHAREAIALYEQVLRQRPDDARTRQNLLIARQAIEHP